MRNKNLWRADTVLLNMNPGGRREKADGIAQAPLKQKLRQHFKQM